MFHETSWIEQHNTVHTQINYTANFRVFELYKSSLSPHSAVFLFNLSLFYYIQIFQKASKYQKIEKNFQKVFILNKKVFFCEYFF